MYVVTLQIDSEVSRLMSLMTERQRKYAKYAEKLGKVHELSHQLNRCHMVLNQTLESMETLNNTLPVEERLEPFVWTTGWIRWATSVWLSGLQLVPPVVRHFVLCVSHLHSYLRVLGKCGIHIVTIMIVLCCLLLQTLFQSTVWKCVSFVNKTSQSSQVLFHFWAFNKCCEKCIMH